jgi:hypothetical protein
MSNGSAALLELTGKEEELRQEITPVISQANAISVRSPDDYSAAAIFLKAMKAAQKKVTDFFGPMKTAAHQAWKKVCDGERTFLEPLQIAERTVKERMTSWQIEEEKKAEKERLKLQAELEKKARKEKEKLEERAARAEENGDTEKAEALREQAEMAVAPAINVESAAPKVDGISTRKVWKATVEDKAAFLTFAAEDKTGVFLAMIEINETALSRIAKGEASPNIPGVIFRRETVMASGSR